MTYIQNWSHWLSCSCVVISLNQLSFVPGDNTLRFLLSINIFCDKGFYKDYIATSSGPWHHCAHSHKSQLQFSQLTQVHKSRTTGGDKNMYTMGEKYLKVCFWILIHWFLLFYKSDTQGRRKVWKSGGASIIWWA